MTFWQIQRHMMTCGLADVDLGQALMANVQRCKYTKPTPVQRYSIPIGIAGRDLMACAQTGSGKTAAFCFPIIANILRAGTPPAPRARKVGDSASRAWHRKIAVALLHRCTALAV